MAEFGQIDVLVNNAGTTWGAPAEEHSLEAWHKVINLNVTGAFLLTQAAAQASMITRKKGRIINVASVAGLQGNHPQMMGTVAYNTSKGALVNMTRALASEWGKYAITVNAIAPGYFPTKMTRGHARVRRGRHCAKCTPRKIGQRSGFKRVSGAAGFGRFKLYNRAGCSGGRRAQCRLKNRRSNLTHPCLAKTKRCVYDGYKNTASG